MKIGDQIVSDRETGDWTLSSTALSLLRTIEKDYEKDEFSKGTLETAKAIVKSKAFSIVGGGETVEFLNRMGLTPKFSHVSTGGGAMLQFLGGEKLPGLEVLE